MRGADIVMKKILSLIGILLLSTLLGINVDAKEKAASEGKVVVALGADLTNTQKQTVLDLMGITQEQLAEYDVVTITNEQEHQYLDAYLKSSLIGTKSLSSVLLKKGEKGSGVTVTTKNINYCTTGMYRNALLTAGIEDTQVIVAAPSQISGTAGLIGAVKAYEQMEGTKISDVSLSNALDELITTGELADAAKNANSDEVEQLIAFLKEKVAKGELETDEDIRKAIKEGEDRFGIVLDKGEVEKIVGLMNKLEGMGLNSDYLLSQAEKLYNKYGADIVNHADEAISDAVNSAVEKAATGFFDSIKDSVKSFFDSIFNKNK